LSTLSKGGAKKRRTNKRTELLAHKPYSVPAQGTNILPRSEGFNVVLQLFFAKPFNEFLPSCRDFLESIICGCPRKEVEV